MTLKVTSDVMECLTSLHRTLSICSRCLECCAPDEREIYAELSNDAAIMLRRLNSAIKANNERTE